MTSIFYQKFKDIISISKHKKITLAKDEFASIADSSLCAYGLAYEATIITLKTYQKRVRKRVKIPNVCREFNIRYIDLLEFMREIGMRF